MSQNLRLAFRNLLAALVAVLDAARVEGRTRAKALHQRMLIALRGRLAAPADVKRAEVAGPIPKEEEPREAPVARVITLRPSEVREQRKLAERRDSNMFDASSVIPPNIERAVTSQMRTSHKDRMTHDDLLRFLTGFGVPKGDARGAVTITRTRTRRDYVIADDLQSIQGWIGKGWIDSRKRSLGATLPNVVRRQLGLASDANLETSVVAEVLVTRGYRIGTAQDIAAKLCDSSEVAQARAR